MKQSCEIVSMLFISIIIRKREKVERLTQSGIIETHPSVAKANFWGLHFL